MEQESHGETTPPAEETLPEPSEPSLTAYQQQDQYDPTEVCIQMSDLNEYFFIRFTKFLVVDVRQNIKIPLN